MVSLSDSEKTIWENSTRKFIVAETPLYGPTYNNPQVIGDVSVALAAQRTFRKDPLNGFQIYTGGWNISSRHYWAVRIYFYFIIDLDLYVDVNLDFVLVFLKW